MVAPMSIPGCHLTCKSIDFSELQIPSHTNHELAVRHSPGEGHLTCGHRSSDAQRYTMQMDHGNSESSSQKNIVKLVSLLLHFIVSNLSLLIWPQIILCAFSVFHFYFAAVQKLGGKLVSAILSLRSFFGSA